MGTNSPNPVMRPRAFLPHCSSHLSATRLLTSVSDAENGSRLGGIGFLVTLPSAVAPGQGILFAVTNAHVIEDGSTVIRLNTKLIWNGPVMHRRSNLIELREEADMPIQKVGWELMITRVREDKRNRKRRTVGRYQVFHNGSPIPGLAGMCAETRGPGDNSKAGNN